MPHVVPSPSQPLPFRESGIAFSAAQPWRLFRAEYRDHSAAVGLHYHGMLEILVCRGVRGSVTVDGHRNSLTRDPVIVIPPSAVHSADIRKGSGDILVFQVSPERLKPILDLELLLKTSGIRWQALSGPAPGAGKIGKILSEAENRNPDSLPSFLGLLGSVLALLPAGRTRIRDAAPDAGRLHRIIEWTENHADRPVSLADASAAIGLDPAYFCRYFKSASGQTWGGYLRSLRMERAAGFLKQGRSVTDACSDSGFGNLSHFIQSFKAVHGLTPSRFRDRILGRRG